jgi:hypothetical protein
MGLKLEARLLPPERWDVVTASGTIFDMMEKYLILEAAGGDWSQRRKVHLRGLL